MANCMTCRHNDRAAKYCSLKRVHTDLGYVLNCVAWAPTAEAEMRRIRTENAKLRELAAELYQCLRQCGCDRCGYKDGCAVFDRMVQLGVEVDQ